MAETNTIIGQSILVKGNLEGDEDLTVQGRVEGTLNLTKTLIIESGGIVKAEVSVANAVVSGVMVGNLTATDSVEITESGRMLGDIQAPRVIINEGALFKGQVDMGDLNVPREASKPAQPRPAATTTSSSSSFRRSETTRRPTAVIPAPARRPEPAREEPARAESKAASGEESAGKPVVPAVVLKPGSTKKKIVVKKK